MFETRPFRKFAEFTRRTCNEEAHIYPVKQNIKAHTHADNDTYLAMYQQSIKDPEGFWSEHGKIVDWIKPFTKVKHTSLTQGTSISAGLKMAR